MLRTPTISAALLGLAGACALSGCTIAYDRSVSGVYDALEKDDSAKALAILDREVAQARPEREALLRLERAVVRLRVGLLADAADDLAQADPVLEVLDLDKDVDGKLAAQLISEAAGSYRPPPFEKLMVNALGMAARLAAGDLEGAAIEARRFAVLARYYDSTHVAEHEAAAAGHMLASLVAEATHGARDTGGEGELVVLVASGRVPRRVTTSQTRGELAQRLGQKASEADAKRSLTVLALDGGKPAAPPEVAVDDAPMALAPLAEPAASARATFERQSARLYRAALNRESLRHSAERASNGGVLGFFVGATLQGNDTPDTRAWSLLPAAIHTARMRVAAGAHRVRIGARTLDVDVAAGRVRVVFVTLP